MIRVFLETNTSPALSVMQTVGGEYHTSRLDSTTIFGVVDLDIAQTAAVALLTTVTVLPISGFVSDATSASPATKTAHLAVLATNGVPSTYTTDQALDTIHTVTGNPFFFGLSSGTISGPSVSIDSEIMLFSGVTGKVAKRATGTGLVTATAGVYGTVQAGSASLLFGRGSANGPGNYEPITLGSGLSMNANVLSASVTGASVSGGSLGAIPSLNDFRLTAVSGAPVYAPAPLVPSSTDTAAETVTFSVNHGYVSGTILTPFNTVGGLTRGTNYYIHVVSATTISFHTTLAAAIAGTSPVNLTANITGVLYFTGVSYTSIYLSPFKGNQISLYNGSSWSALSSGPVTLALGTLTSGLMYDVFAYSNAGVLAIELLAWSSNTARATALVLQDGVYLKTGDLTRRYVGSFETDSTTSTIQAWHKQFIYNENNQVRLPIAKYSTDASWTYATPNVTIRQANNNAANQIEICAGNLGILMALTLYANGKCATTTGFVQVGLGEDVTNAMMNPTDGSLGGVLQFGMVANIEIMFSYHMRHFIPLGKHTYAWCERGDASSVFTFQGDDGFARRYGIIGDVIM